MPYIGNTYHRRRFIDAESFGYIVGLILVLIACTANIWMQIATRNEVTAKVMSVDIKRVEKDKDKYLVNVQYPSGEFETLSIEDSLVNGNVTSADKYFELKNNIGKTYILKVYGWRNGFLSWFRVIYAVQKIE